MKQLILNLKNGAVNMAEVPAPQPGAGKVLIQSLCSLVSPGTEGMLVSFGKAGLLQKARQQPEKVAQVFQKIKTDGLQATLSAVRQKLDQPIALGYSNVGVVLATGAGVNNFKPGDRVVSNGAHAEIVCVPKNLVAKIPDTVTNEEAAFTVVGAVALQSIRLLSPSFGETVLVLGLGLIGQLTAQLLLANGCVVIASDIDESRVQLAVQQGINAIHSAGGDVLSYIAGHIPAGVDGVIITASTASDSLLSIAANACRQRGRMVLSGVTGLNLKRDDFFKKELTFQVSAAYGPGRYDAAYEEKGIDYPVAFVRWTANRNFLAILQALGGKKLNVLPLLSERVLFSEAPDLYQQQKRPGIITSLITYKPVAAGVSVNTVAYRQVQPGGAAGMALIGAGGFSVGTLLPALQQLKAPLQVVCSENGLSAGLAAKKFSIPAATSDVSAIWKNAGIGSVIIATRHDSHAALVCSALESRKHVFVEKPLALSAEELDRIEAAHTPSVKLLHVGYNRRFSLLAQKAKTLIRQGLPLNIVATMNAGFLPADHWTQDPLTGGGRIIGEACHLIDLCVFLTGSLIAGVMAAGPENSRENASILLTFANGSHGAVHYFSNGSKLAGKERIEMQQGGTTLIIDNWRSLTGYGVSGFSSLRGAQDKGHKTQLQQWLLALKTGRPLIPAAELFNVSQATFAAVESLADWQYKLLL